MLQTGAPVVLPVWVQQVQAWLNKGARWLVIGLAGIAILTVGLRCLRLADPNHYYLFSPDSYFFHWLAQRVMAGQGPPVGSTGANYTLQSGLAYPMAYIAKAVSYVFNLSSAESLALVAKFLPPILALVTMILLYIGVSRILGRRVALFASLAWAVFYYAVIIGAGGYADRDGLSALLLLTGALLFYIFKDYHAHLGKMDVGWLPAGVGVLVVEGLLYLEWGLTGAAMLLAILLVYVVLKLLVVYVSLMEKQPNTLRRISTTVKNLELWPLCLIAGVNIIVMAMYYHQVSLWFPYLWSAIQARLSVSGQVGQGAAAEVTGLTPWDLIFGFQFFLLLIALGIYSAWKSKKDAFILFTGWFVSFAVLSLFSWRLLLYAIPAACVVAGLGFDYLWEWRKRGAFPISRNLVVVVLIILLLVISANSAASLNGGSEMTVDQNWQEALTYIRDSTPTGAVVMSQWSYGYWILDLGERTPFVDNGYYGYDPARLYDVGRVYFTSDPAEAAQIMAKCGTEYLVFAEGDLDVASSITGWASLKDYNSFPADSLVVRSLNGDFVSGGGLEVVFYNDEVVILRLAGETTIGLTMQ